MHQRSAAAGAAHSTAGQSITADFLAGSGERGEGRRQKAEGRRQKAEGRRMKDEG
jgi:hypothetical protein